MNKRRKINYNQLSRYEKEIIKVLVKEKHLLINEDLTITTTRDFYIYMNIFLIGLEFSEVGAPFFEMPSKYPDIPSFISSGFMGINLERKSKLHGRVKRHRSDTVDRLVGEPA